MNELSAVASFFKEGGGFMYAILGTGVVIIAIVAERLLVVGRAAAINSRRLTDDLVRCIGRGDLNGARNLSIRSNAPVARVAQTILQIGPADEGTLQSAADDAATLALPPLAKRLAHLSTLANVATLLGLLGTIFGLTQAFAAVGAADPAQRSAFLAAGIAQALNTTAFGLIIAVPTLLVHGYLTGLVESVAEQIDEVGIRLTRALVAMHGSAHVTPIAVKGTGTSRGVVVSQGGAR